MLASVTSFYGNHGQAAYCASTSFLDAFAAYRRLHGLPAATIDLSVVEDVGYIAETDALKRAQFESLGHDKIREDELLSLLKAAIIHKADGCDYHGPKTLSQPQTPLVGFRTQSFPHPARIELPHHQNNFDFAGHSARKTPRRGNFRRRGDQVVRDALVRKISQLSTTPLEDIEPDQPLLAYGLNSLVEVDLRNWMVGELGSRVSLLELTNSPSIEALATIFEAQSSFVELAAVSKENGRVEI